MSEPRNCNSSRSGKEAGQSTPGILFSESDERFFRSLNEFIDHEKRLHRCPDDGPDELRYFTYRSVFNQVIGRATSYKKILLSIKTEYDDVVKEMKRRKDEAAATQRNLTASTSHPRSVETCRRRADLLRDRISELQGETAKLQDEIEKKRLSQGQSEWISGLTVAESQNPSVLDKHLKHFEAQRDVLLDTKRCSVSVDVKHKLDAKLQNAERHKEQLNGENERLRLLYKRLRCVSKHLSSCEDADDDEDDEGRQVPLEERLISTLQIIRQISEATGDDGDDIIDVELFEGDEPSGMDESEHLSNHLNSFIELLDSAQYKDAALLAATSPRGVLRNLDIMEMFEGAAAVSPGSPAPPLLFAHALLVTTAPSIPLPASLSVRCVDVALRHGASRLVVHAFAKNKLTTSEHLGDVLTKHAQEMPAVSHLCLALATDVYRTCRLNRKSALSMCRRGLEGSAAEFLSHCDGVMADDCMWLLCHSPSVLLLKLLTEKGQRPAAMLSLGRTCSTLLVNPKQRNLVLQLLDDIIFQGREVLEDVILEDSGSSVDVWIHVASLCSQLNRADLSSAVLSILMEHGGTRVLTPDMDGARLMEHISL